MEGAIETRQDTEGRYEELSRHHEAKLQIVQERGAEIERLMQENESFSSRLTEALGGLQERDTRIAQAQQHLAKKVKENTIFQEKFEQQKIQGLEKQNQLNASKSKLNELNRSLELQQQQEKKLQGLLNDSLKSVEAQANKWEEKYFRMYDKWQTSETRIRELQKLEE